MNIPWYSTFTLFTEIFITVGVFYVVLSAWKKNVFFSKFAAFLVSYEILFNITYMVNDAMHGHPAGAPSSGFYTALAIFHGIFSLIMFLGLLVFMGYAWWRYHHGMNFFKDHPRFTIIFLSSWMIALLSGILVYFVRYFS